MPTPKFCSSCGESLNEGAKFCAGCGAKVEADAVAAPTAAPAATEARRPEAPDLDKPAAKPAPGGVAAQAMAGKAASEAAAKAPAVAAKAAAKSRVADLMVSDDDDDDDSVGAVDDGDQLEPPTGEAKARKRAMPMSTLVMIGFGAVVLIAAIAIGTNAELNARFRCNILGQAAACITEEDRLFEIEQAEKKEEIELMTHHYGGFDLNFSPDKESSFTIRQHRYEEDRKAFVARIREGASDTRTRKESKTGVYAEKQSPDGIIKGTVRFATDAPSAVTYTPTKGKGIVLPLSLPELPLLEREQEDGNGKRLTLEDIERIEKAKEKPDLDDDGKPVRKPELKVKTVAVSTWVYEIVLTAEGYKPRTVWFYENPAPPDLDVKKLEAEGATVRQFKRRPDGRFVIDNASFDLVPEPRTLWTRYIQALKELHCLKQGADFKGRSEQEKANAEALLWEQKAFTTEILAIARENDADPEFIKHKDEQFKGYVCPTM